MIWNSNQILCKKELLWNFQFSERMNVMIFFMWMQSIVYSDTIFFFSMNNKNYLNRVYINVKRDLFSRLCADTLDLKGHTYIHLCIRHLVKLVFQIFDHKFNDKLHYFFILVLTSIDGRCKFNGTCFFS